MKIDVRKLEEIAALLFKRFKDRNGNEFVLDSDYYWDISSEEIYCPYENPKNMTLGQLSDDFVEISRLLEGEDPISYDFKRLASILVALSIEHPISI
jgi:hypothetical protein